MSCVRAVVLKKVGWDREVKWAQQGGGAMVLTTGFEENGLVWGLVLRQQ